MSKLTSKVRRRILKVANGLTRPDKDKISKLVDLIELPPSTRPALDQWSNDVHALIHGLVIDRITKEDLSLVLTGLISYHQTGITPERTQLALVRAYENSSGLFQEVLHKALFRKLDEPKQRVRSELFGEISVDMIDNIVSGMSEDGYFVLPFKINERLIEQIKSESESYSYRLKGENPSQWGNVDGIDPKAPPACISAYASSGSIKNSALLQQIVNDELFRRVSSQYLECSASAIDSTFWYTFPWPRPSSETAQLFHYDLDTIRWIKVFVYLTDVDSNNGPHEYVVASHLAKNKPPEILVRNYARIDDQDIDRFFPGKRKSLTGDAGTVIFGDTRCFHKGTAVNRGHRLIFSPIYAPSKIGYFHGLPS